MTKPASEKVSVLMVSGGDGGETMPVKLTWRGRTYRVTKLGFHHTVRVGRSLHHIYSVVAGQTFFRLNFDTESLSWSLEEVSEEV